MLDTNYPGDCFSGAGRSAGVVVGVEQPHGACRIDQKMVHETAVTDFRTLDHFSFDRFFDSACRFGLSGLPVEILSVDEYRTSHKIEVRTIGLATRTSERKRAPQFRKQGHQTSFFARSDGCAFESKASPPLIATFAEGHLAGALRFMQDKGWDGRSVCSLNQLVSIVPSLVAQAGPLVSRQACKSSACRFAVERWLSRCTVPSRGSKQCSSDTL